MRQSEVLQNLSHHNHTTGCLATSKVNTMSQFIPVSETRIFQLISVFQSTNQLNVYLLIRVCK